MVQKQVFISPTAGTAEQKSCAYCIWLKYGDELFYNIAILICKNEKYSSIKGAFNHCGGMVDCLIAGHPIPAQLTIIFLPPE